MNKKSYFQSERNNYFFGKLMTVRDFENEQIYHNSKRRLINRMLHGAGIVSGMGVIFVNNQTVSIEKGMAIDYLGQEVIVPESIIKKISTIDGFDECNHESTLYLCIEYIEQLKETTFSVAKTSSTSDLGNEFNRINESYRLFLTSDKPCEEFLDYSSMIKTITTVIDTKDFKISIETPKYSNPQEIVKIVVNVEKTTLKAPVKYNFNIISSLFEPLSHKEENCVLEKGDVFSFSNEKTVRYVRCCASYDGIDHIVIKKEGTSPQINEDISIPIKITSKNIKDMIIEDFYSRHFDDIIDIKEDQRLYLAKFNVISRGVTYFIENLKTYPANQYLLSTTLINTLNDMDYKRNQMQKIIKEDAVKEVEVPILEDKEPSIKMTTGVYRINLGFSPKVNKSFISADIIHGLNVGKVAVILAYESESNILDEESEISVIGDSDVFNDKSLDLSIPKLKIGVILYPKKGTMKIGVKLLSPAHLRHIDIRWWAYECNGDTELQMESYSEAVKIIITPDTAQIKPKEQIRFNATITGAINQEVIWQIVKETGGGTIDNNGVYTAPGKEGVYAIMAQSSNFEQQVATAYVVVKE